MAIEMDTSTVREIKFDGSDVKIVKYNGEYVWAKPFGFSLVAPSSFVSTAWVHRGTTYEPTAVTGSITGIDTVYYGDKITVYARTKPGWSVTGTVSTTMSPGVVLDTTVSASIFCSISAYPFLESPTLGNAMFGQYSGNIYRALASVTNNNSYSVTCDLVVGSVTVSSVSISAGNSKQFYGNYNNAISASQVAGSIKFSYVYSGKTYYCSLNGNWSVSQGFTTSTITR